MATPPLSREVAEATVQRVNDALRAGYRPAGMTGPGPGAIAKAAQDAVDDGFNTTVSAFENRVRTARTLHNLEPDWSLYRPAIYQQPRPKVVLHPAMPIDPAALVPSGKTERILAIGDIHHDPRHEDRLEVMKWIARHASATRPDRIIQVGDWSSWDSVSSHDRNDTQKARYKPPISADMDNLTASHQRFRAGLADDYKPKLTFLHGNHEYRVERFENANPETHQTFTVQRDQIFAQFGWQTRPYGEIYYVQGVGFTHHPINGAGRAFGGKTGPQRAANETTIPVVSGHTHRRQVHDAPKIGPVASISMVEIGCAMPWGTVEEYAAHSMTGWWWGVVDLTLSGGVIVDVSFVSMLTLRARYSDDGADVRSA